MSSTFMDIIVVDDEVMLNNGGSKLKVRVGGTTLGVVMDHKVGDDVRWKGMTPEKWGASTQNGPMRNGPQGQKDDTIHATASSIWGAMDEGVSGH
jgi:hypothetical protein